MLSPFLEEKGPCHTVHPTFCPRPKQDVSTCQAGRFKNNGPTFRTQSGEETQFISRGAQEREQTRSSREGMHELWGPRVSSARRRIQNPLASERPLGAAHCGCGQPPAWAKLQAVFTPVTREEEGEKREPQQSPKLLSGSREGGSGPARSCGQVAAEGQGEPAAAAGEVTTTLTSPAGARGGKEEAVRFGAAAAAGFPAPAAEEGRARARSPQARRAGTSPQPPGSAADR
ncbi:uncharacterized protein LOC118717767 isoform X2 [Pipistrellus kuhlii]|nr:uncharacterized protein LOC118717767 isoform X2 [Pipistrellus kuhlii]